MMSIKTEFEKAFQEHTSYGGTCMPSSIQGSDFKFALWAANWMAEAIIRQYDLGASAEINIRQLVKELE